MTLIPAVIAFKGRAGTVVGFPGADNIKPEELLAMDCQIQGSAALENAITHDNARTIHARIIAEAANGRVTPEADRILIEKGVFRIPDILCNADGVTVSYFEWVQDGNHLFRDENDVNLRLEKVMKRSFNDVLKIHLDCRADMRLAANMLGVSRVADAARIRGFYPQKGVASHGGRLPASLLALHEMSRHYNKCSMSTVRKSMFLTDTEC